MPWEVEQKFRVVDADQLRVRLLQVGCGIDGATLVHQTDRYFAHPCRDFAQTDEALRLRSDSAGLRITYKGPKIDATTKTRREIELPLAATADTEAQYAELLEALGFRLVAAVEKHRRTWTLPWQEQSIEIAWDDVLEVGQYIELEISAEQDGIDAAKAALAALAIRLGLSENERRSYLELLLGG